MPDGILMHLCAFGFGWNYLGCSIVGLGRTKKYAAFTDFDKPAVVSVSVVHLVAAFMEVYVEDRI